MAMNVKNKTAIITGAGSGINFEFAKLLLSKGCNVIVADLSLRPEAKVLVDKYGRGEEGARALFLKTDVTHWTQLAKMFEIAEQEFGSADIVVPGAGIFEPPFSNFWQPPDSPKSKDSIENSRYALVDINITHPIRTTQLAISHFLKHNKPGCVVHISSVAGQVTNFANPMYVASKHALNGFVMSLAALEEPYSIAVPGNLKMVEGKVKRVNEGRDLPKIRVNGVAPGLIKTPLWTDNPEKMSIVSNVDDWVLPEEVAEVMLRCVQDEEMVGGSIFEVAGNGIRKVNVFNDPGPKVGNHGKSEPEKQAEDTWSRLSTEGWGQ